MIFGKYYLGPDHMQEVEMIRKEVFHAESGYADWAATDEIDEISVHAVIYTDLERTDAAACARLYRDENHEDFRIDRLAVKESGRGNGYGDFLVRMLVDKGLAMGADRILVESPKEYVVFFEKIGFHSVKNEDTKEFLDSFLLEIRQNQICKACQRH